MLSKFFYRITLAVAFSLASVSANAEYTFSLLNGLGSFSIPMAINASGQVVGGYNNGGNRAAFLWNGTTASDIGIIGTSYNFATSINTSGQIVGNSAYTGTGTVLATLWDNGNATNLGTFGGDPIYPTSINDSGQIAAISFFGSGPYQAILLSNGTTTSLGTLGGNTYSTANSINASGQVVGVSQSTYQQTNGFSVLRATLWSDGTITDLGTLGGNLYSISEASSINNSGQIVGYSATSNGRSHAALWSNGTITDLGTLGGVSSWAKSINALGQIVGSSTINGDGSQNYYNDNRATLWNGTDITDLNSFLSPTDVADGWVLNDARGINDSGSIVGSASNSILGIQSQAFLLTPVPEADTSAMLLTGLGVLGFAARRRKKNLAV